LIGWVDAEPLYPDFLTGEDLLAFYRDIPSIGRGKLHCTILSGNGISTGAAFY
jgi:hypothetical protein